MSFTNRSVVSFASLALAASFTAAFGCAAASDEELSDVTSDVSVSADKRVKMLAGARVWDADEFAKIRQKTPEILARGQAFADAPIPGSSIVCQFKEPTQPGEVGGKTPKFLCDPAPAKPGDETRAPLTKQLKIKYSGLGRPTTEINQAQLSRWRAEDAKENGEVFSEAAGTRLMWALGFYADGVYPVKVRCYGCPERPFEAYARPGDTKAGGERADRDFFFGAAEVKLDGKKIEQDGVADDKQGFSWTSDLPLIQETSGGSPRKVLEGWKLFAAFTYHSDNKPANQRLVCPKGAFDEVLGTCTAPVRAFIQDIGASFGSAKPVLGIGSIYKKAELGAWQGQSVWEGAGSASGVCKANLKGTHELTSPEVADEGRDWLAEKLNALSDEQLTAIFTASRIANRGEKIADRLVTVQDWVDTFKAKRAELTRGCR
jgi:hypothetical protein